MKSAAVFLAFAFTLSILAPMPVALADCIGCTQGPPSHPRVKCPHGEKWDPDILMCVPF